MSVQVRPAVVLLEHTLANGTVLSILVNEEACSAQVKVFMIIKLVFFLHCLVILKNDWILALYVINCSVAGALRLVCGNDESLLLLLLLVVCVVAVIVIVLSVRFCASGWSR